MDNRFNLPGKEKSIQIPDGGWIERTWYLVEVSFNANNPIHRALLYTSFLDSKGRPAGYHCLVSVNNSYEPETLNYHSLHFLRVVGVAVDSLEKLPWE